MSFTDDDLKRLKEMIKDTRALWVNGENAANPILALLDRLEAAEQVIKSSVFPSELDRASMNALNKWCESRGELSYEKWFHRSSGKGEK